MILSKTLKIPVPPSTTMDVPNWPLKDLPPNRGSTQYYTLLLSVNIKCIKKCRYFQRNKRPLPDRGYAACFLRNPWFIVYEHDSYVGFTLRKCHLSYMTVY